MGRSYKKVPDVKKKEIIEICKNKYLQETTDTLLYYLENTKNRIKKEYEVAVRYIKNSQRLLFFKSGEIANKFLEEQKELLEIAKPLL